MSEFKVEDMATADWALKKIKEAEDVKEKNKIYADKEIKKVRDWLEDVDKEQDHTIEFMSGHLQKYLMGEGKRSMKLINGNIGLRKRQDKWQILNDAELVKTLETAGFDDLVRVKKTSALSDMKKVFEVHNGRVIHLDTGETIEGIEIVPQADSFNVKTN